MLWPAAILVMNYLRYSRILLVVSFLFSSGAGADDFIWGIGTHLMGSPTNAAHIANIKEAGFVAFRDDAKWNAVETKKGVYEFPKEWSRYIDGAASVGIKPLLIIDYGNPLYGEGREPVDDAYRDGYVSYANRLAQYFKGRVRLYEVWNEWDMSRSGSVEPYLNLLRDTYRSIKRVDADAIVLGGGFLPWTVDKGLREFVRRGGLSFVDGISIHPYVYCESAPTPESFLRRIEQVQQQLASVRMVPIYITEMGWPSNTGACGFRETDVARYMIGAYLIAKCIPQVAGMWWYDLKNDGNDAANREHNFGVFDVSWAPKPAYKSASLIGRVNGDLTCSKPIVSGLDDALYVWRGVGEFGYRAILEKLYAQLTL